VDRERRQDVGREDGKLRTFLAAATPLPVLERALALVSRKTGRKLEWAWSGDGRVGPVDAAIFGGFDAWRAGRGGLREGAFCVVAGDPFSLARIEGESVVRLDHEPSGEGYGWKTADLAPEKIAAVMAAEIGKGSPAAPEIVSGGDPVEAVLGSIFQGVTFVQDLAVLTYALKGESERAEVKAEFCRWAASDEPTSALRASLSSIMRNRKKARVEAIAAAFDPPDGDGVRRAVRSALTEPDGKFDAEEIAAKGGTSAYDLRYVRSLGSKPGTERPERKRGPGKKSRKRS